jgi:hypothetical protein
LTAISAGRLPEARKQRLGEFASEIFMRPSPQALMNLKEIGRTFDLRIVTSSMRAIDQRIVSQS